LTPFGRTVCAVNVGNDEVEGEHRDDANHEGDEK
jgi:hypothetical protein